jgi:hypothetical protein
MSIFPFAETPAQRPENVEKPVSVLRRYHVGIASVPFRERKQP